MVELDSVRVRISELKEIVADIGDSMKLDELQSRLDELTEKQHAEDFWLDMKTAQAVSKEAKTISNKLEGYAKLKSDLENLSELADMVDEMEELSEVQGVKEELALLEKRIEELRLATLLRGEYDDNDAILTLHAGAGGTEAQDWASMLYRMYTRYAEKKGYAVKVIDLLPGDEAGIKSVTFSLSGENVYGYMKAEKGVHRLVRISPFDANSRRHTSFASLEVMPVIENDEEIKISPDELKIDTYRSGGAGGQHVNKTESAIRITHIPTGIVVACQNERSQIQNREVAMTMLRAKLAELRERERENQQKEIQGELKKIEWGSQIRSYVFCPYTMVKDHRTGYETGNVAAVMDGDIEDFITDYLKKSV